MFVVQAIVFSPWVKPETTRWFIAPALAVLAAGLFLVPRASNFTLMLVVIGAVAASAGILSPILTYWISSKAGKSQGAELGKQTAAASLGVTVGSAAGGLLFDVPWLPGASFLLVTVLIVSGVLLSLGLPNMLMTRKRDENVDDTDAGVRDIRAQVGNGSEPLKCRNMAGTGEGHVGIADIVTRPSPNTRADGAVVTGHPGPSTFQHLNAAESHHVARQRHSRDQ